MTKIKFKQNDDIERYWGEKLEKELNYSSIITRENQLKIIKNYIHNCLMEMQNNSSDIDATKFSKESKIFLEKTFNELKNRKFISFKINKNKLKKQKIKYEPIYTFINSQKAYLEMMFIESKQFLHSKDFTDFCIEEFKKSDKLSYV